MIEPKYFAKTVQEAFVHFLDRGNKPILCSKEGVGVTCRTYREAVVFYRGDKRPAVNRLRRTPAPVLGAAS